MLNLKNGIVEKIIAIRGNFVEVLVNIDGNLEKAIAYMSLANDIKEGNKVVLNTTAVDLKLGSGGFHFVLAVLSNSNKQSNGYGHIMKLRYTPIQVKVNSAEEQKSIYHDIFNSFSTLNNMPVLIGGLHSMLAPLSVVLKGLNSNLNIGYIMTDGGALPIDFSETVYNLKKKGIIKGTITIGNAFGGDHECINIYNGLIAAKEILKCDVCIVAMGPGIVGTGTKYGFTGIEQGNIIDAVNDLGGVPICIPRISFRDKRERHYGISHHTITVLNDISKTKAYVAVPKFQNEREAYVKKQIETNGIDKKHDVLFVEFSDIINILKKSDINMKTMGRTLEDDTDYFVTAGVNAKVATYFIS